MTSIQYQILSFAGQQYQGKDNLSCFIPLCCLRCFSEILLRSHCTGNKETKANFTRTRVLPTNSHCTVSRESYLTFQSCPTVVLHSSYPALPVELQVPIKLDNVLVCSSKDIQTHFISSEASLEYLVNILHAC